jgi:hypothetical protein
VVNFAETAYVSTQDVLMLEMQLRSGNVPDLVIFYSLEGDVYAAYQTGRADVPQNLNQLAARFETPERPPSLLELVTSSQSYSLIEHLTGKLTVGHPGQGEPAPSKLVTYESRGIEVTSLANSIVRNYIENYKIVKALAQTHGFTYFFFLQPIISRGNKSLTGEEQEIKQRLERDVALNKLLTAVYQTLELGAGEFQNLHPIHDVFDGHSSLVWIDPYHVTPVGNQLIAKRILDLMHVDAP